MELNPNLALHYTASVRSAAPLNRSKNRFLRVRTPELHDSKEQANQFKPKNSPKNTYKNPRKGLKSQLFGIRIPAPTTPQHPHTHPLENKYLAFVLSALIALIRGWIAFLSTNDSHWD
jgi:hypothetical protein